VACALAVAFGSSLALAVPTLVDIPPVVAGDGSEGRCITPDGMYAGGISGAAGLVWDAVNGTRQPIAGGYQDAVYGIGYRTPAAGGPVELVIGGPNSGWESMNASTDGGLTWVKRRRSGTPTANPYGGGPSNTVSGGSTGGMIYATFKTPNSNTPQLYIDAWNDAGWASAPDTKGTTTQSDIIGVSNNGVAVGRRKDGAGLYQNYVLTFDGDGGLGAAFVPGLDGTNHGELWDIADDGSVAGGVSPTPTDSRVNAFIRDMTSGNVFDLPELGGPNTDLNTVNRVYGVGPNGDYAVGMDYTYGIELAVLWDISDPDPANWTVTDLTQFATDNGILGDFTGNLRRAYAVGVDGDGNPVITGYGYASALDADDWTGYVLTLPEPSSLGLLALGGLALLRRRRS
jgi:hypothetical protein